MLKIGKRNRNSQTLIPPHNPLVSIDGLPRRASSATIAPGLTSSGIPFSSTVRPAALGGARRDRRGLDMNGKCGAVQVDTPMRFH